MLLEEVCLCQRDFLIGKPGEIKQCMVHRLIICLGQIKGTEGNKRTASYKKKPSPSEGVVDVAASRERVDVEVGGGAASSPEQPAKIGQCLQGY